MRLKKWAPGSRASRESELCRVSGVWGGGRFSISGCAGEAGQWQWHRHQRATAGLRSRSDGVTGREPLPLPATRSQLCRCRAKMVGAWFDGETTDHGDAVPVTSSVCLPKPNPTKLLSYTNMKCVCCNLRQIPHAAPCLNTPNCSTGRGHILRCPLHVVT